MISKVTLEANEIMSVEFYDINHEEFIQSTVDVDMRLLYEKFCTFLPAKAKILDAGCGSGRDALYFKQNGFQVVAIDASAKMVQATQRLSGVDCRQMSFEHLAFEKEFNAVWACASLLHVARDRLASVLCNFANVLLQDGLMYASFKHGNQERQVGLRYFNDMNAYSLEKTVSVVSNLKIEKIWLTDDARPNRSEEKWLNAILKKV